MKKTVFIKNALVLSATSMVLRFAGIIIKIWLAAKIGAEGIGLYQLTFSVYVLASTFASAGISTAVTRLIADELALGSRNGTIKILKRSIQITLLIAIISAIIVFFFAPTIANAFLKDNRSIPSLKILTFSLPFMAVSACLKGYFIARRKATPCATSLLLEQAIRVILLFFIIDSFSHKGLAFCCAAILFSDAVAEGGSCIFLYFVYRFDKRKLEGLSGRPHPDYPIVKRLMAICAPITLGRYLNSFLRTAENILVPINLAKYRFSSATALEQFGMIKGMALPILFFPSSVLSALTTLLIPEMSEAMAKKRYLIIKNTTETVLRITSIISFIFGAIFLFSGKQIGLLIYKSSDVGFLLCALAPIVPLMYIDSVADGILKGLDCQNYTFKTAAADSTLRIILILIFVPLGGMKAFLSIMYFSNLFTCFLHLNKLIKVSGAKMDAFKDIFLPILIAVTVTIGFNYLFYGLNRFGALVYIIPFLIVSIIAYLGFLFLFGSIKKEDFYII